MQLSDSKTLENLKTAFANEAAAMVRYEIYADKAKSDGDEEISQVFRTTAKNERAHAELWFGLIFGGIPKTAAHGENYEWTQMYKEYAETARQEKLDNIADLFELVGAIEKDHESRFNTFAQMLSDGSIRSSSGETVWLCRNCGHIVVGVKAPQVCPPECCPVCRRPQGYFQRKEDSRLS